MSKHVAPAVSDVISNKVYYIAVLMFVLTFLIGPFVQLYVGLMSYYTGL